MQDIMMHLSGVKNMDAIEYLTRTGVVTLEVTTGAKDEKFIPVRKTDHKGARI
jgi:hypothetical protein